jgi:hypothetical protein
MAIYKVPQDVEAEDKLLGPFSFKQFIFLLVTVMAIGLAYGLSKIVLPLALIPLPVAIFFGMLALPLRKDQPMEVYLAAVFSFIMRPKVRLWKPDGIETLIEVIAPQVDDKQYGKGYSEEEIQKRLSYLANIVDSRGWAVRGVAEPESSLQADLYNEAQAVIDPMDDREQQIDTLLLRSDQERRQEILTRMHQPQPIEQPTPVVQTPQPTQPVITVPQPEIIASTPVAQAAPQPEPTTAPLVINPYPTMNQMVISPITSQPAVAQPQLAPVSPQITTPTPSTTTVSPAIMDLASNHESLSIDTLGREAKRIETKELESEEVVISLH